MYFTFIQRNIKTVAIIGGGPSGCSLATLPKRKGYKVAVFHLEKRPEIIVGESLVPAIIPLRKLGVEDEVILIGKRNIIQACLNLCLLKPGFTPC